VRVRYTHFVFEMKTVRKVLAFFDKQFIIVDRVRGLMLKKEYQEYKFTTTQSLKDQFLKYELKYEEVKEKRVEISDKEKEQFLDEAIFTFLQALATPFPHHCTFVLHFTVYIFYYCHQVMGPQSITHEYK
jgi:hypothetical protein